MFGTKFIIMGVAALAITTAVGGFFLYQRSIVSGLNDQIVTLENTVREKDSIIQGQRLDMQKLELSNASLEQTIERQERERENWLMVLEESQRSNQASQERLLELEKRLTDQDRQNRIEAIRNSRKASLLLRIVNRNIECEIENFSNPAGGRCVSGRWIPNQNNVEQE